MSYKYILSIAENKLSSFGKELFFFSIKFIYFVSLARRLYLVKFIFYSFG